MTTTTETLPSTRAAIPLRVQVLRKLNPVIVRLLESPLHGLASRDILVLRVRGRRSGRRYVLPLSYVERDGALHLCTRPTASSWWRNIGAGTDVEIAWRGRIVPARAQVLDASSPEALGGLRAFLTRNPGTRRLLYDVGTEQGRPSETDLAREVHRSIVVRLDPSPADAG